MRYLTHRQCLQYLFYAVLLLACTGSAFAVSKQNSKSENPNILLKRLSQEMRQEGISNATIRLTMEYIAQNQIAHSLPNKHRSARASILQHISQDKLQTAQRMHFEQQELLTRISQTFGVQSRFLVAMWAVQTQFGEVDTVPLLPLLIERYCQQPEKVANRRELIAALRHIDRGSLAPDTHGTINSTLGQSSLLPSQLEYAVDFDRDGKIDLTHSYADIFASMANQLAQQGWHGDEMWGRPVKLPADFDDSLIGTQQQMRLDKWHKLGITRIDGTALPKARLLASLIQPDGPSGGTYMVYNNYYSLLRQQRSSTFAVTVGRLSDFIGNLPNRIDTFASVD